MSRFAKFTREVVSKTKEVIKSEVCVDLTKIVYIEKISDGVTKLDFINLKTIEVCSDFDTVLKMWEDAVK